MLSKNNFSSEKREIIKREFEIIKTLDEQINDNFEKQFNNNIYQYADLLALQNFFPKDENSYSGLQTLDELLERDSKREKDGFMRRIRLGKYIKEGNGNKSKVVVVPSTTEPKFYHDDSISEEDEDTTGGSGEGEEGEVIGQQQAEPEEGEGQGAGQGQGAEHDIGSEAFDLGKIISEKFQLPNLKDKGKKKSFTKYTYDLTDKNRGFGQVLDKKSTLKKVIQTNILLGRISQAKEFNPEELIVSPKDEIYRILSKEKAFEAQAVVFFLRDYSGSMQGKPTEAISTQHLLIYSWLMFQYKNNVETRFILHDTDAKEVPDFHTYFTLQIAGGTEVAPAFKLVNEIVEKENLEVDYNIYVFYGTDGDDWDNEGEKLIPELEKMLKYVSRIGITISKNSWSKGKTTVVEKYLEKTGLLESKADLIRIDSFDADSHTEEQLIESIKKLIS
ncbi:MAG: DUF444 family protein [Bacteroidales bacterium]|nr:DUF444 family protein [Bacteroidales bacterium]MBN2756302.1 DUF444 family protein [Bacteroidales bacterium]